MKEFKGTPGPWILDKRVACVAIYPDGRQGDTEGCHSDDERNIAYSCKGAEYDDVVGYWSMDKQTVHDFTLMAAAPDLLEALQEVVKVLDGAGCEAATVKAKVAISKALGEE
ncbi:hypothetical protein [Enterobacter ludwigii]|uniref:hypothetical protein n=1 Tax=Enterobacter ludwigii TaxID=299767 RepID=UPI003975B84B